jgi:N-acetylglucosaminyl-diphospho-decaprenol L-rhamnosyltransferase
VAGLGVSISVIISNLNGARFLPRLLETLKGQQGVTLQLIVVDRESKDESHQILAQHPDVEVISEPPESGLVAGYHKGVTRARHDLLFFCNEDMWFAPDCLALVQQQFEVQGVGRVGAVMPMQLNWEGTARVNAGVWFTSSLWYRSGPYPFRASAHREISMPDTLSGINAGACMISRAAYEDVGGWDTTFFLDFEDLDLSIRLWQRGWTCRIDPRAIVHHAVGASNAQMIHKGRSTVGRKRYVAALSNQLVVAMKMFTGWAPLLVPALFADRMLRDLGKLRFESARLDVAAASLTLRRLPDVLRYRRSNRAVNQQRPGQRFFNERSFDVNGPPNAQPGG